MSAKNVPAKTEPAETVSVKTVPTAPFAGQNPGTSGLRKTTAEFARPHYAENFIESILRAAGPFRGKLLVIGGDGRFYNREVIQSAVKMAAAHGAGKIMIGRGGILSTPAASHLIRKYRAHGGIILSASHNPGGAAGDFGIKYNAANGGPAPEKLTRAIFAESQKLSEYKIADMADIDIDRCGVCRRGLTEIAVIDGVRDYAALMEDLFDFPLLRRFCAAPAANFRFRFDAMNAVTGPYAQEIFERRLGLPQGTVARAAPLPDFGKIHPDPNLHYAKALCDEVMAADGPDFGAASDGDGDRNLIVGRGMFVTPSDSLAILAANARLVKAYKSGIKGIARSMPTSAAADRAAAKLGIPCYETPTGWKFFGNLLDSGKVTFCGEESFGAGASHVREKDGLWAVLMWLSLLAATGKSVKQLTEEHWAEYGRNYYARHDYEGVDSAAAEALMADLRGRLAALRGARINGLVIREADDFTYRDPVDGSVSRRQGIRLLLANGGRAVFRLSGTGTQGATLRLYLEHYEPDKTRQNSDAQAVLAPLAALADSAAQLKARLNRAAPSVIT